MTLASALSIADSGLTAINAQFALVSHNVANASTPGYAAETSADQAVTAGGQGMGVIAQPAQRATDTALQASLLQQNGIAAGLQTTANALAAIAATQGTPGQGGDLASMLGALQDSFSTLLDDPSSQPQQHAVLQAAGNLATSLNALSASVTEQRQAAQDALVSGVAAVNQDLTTIGNLSDQIMQAKSQGQSTADLENQRDAAISDLSQYLAVTVLPQANGDVVLTTEGGVQLPIHGAAAPLSIASAAAGPGAYYPGGGLPGIMLNGTDVTAALTGGKLAANVALRDTALPTYQAELDEFAQNLSAGFAAQGLPLFTNAAGAVPAGGGMPVQSGYVGYAAAIEVNPQIAANPNAVRDGFPSQNASGLAGFNSVITNVLQSVLGDAPVDGGHVAGLGPAGTLNASFAQPATLADFATAILGGEAADSAAAASQLSSAQALQSGLQSKLASATGVNMDTEMSSMIALQNAYAANAKIIGALQAMYGDVLNMVVQP
ncbi:MAG TPA: flagellar hook-associated protein FlgK [Acetobacteraceae bacterium]|nr:flagellar hook-associated protein FlgK [Acetobacteraceae bacterium]